MGRLGLLATFTVALATPVLAEDPDGSAKLRHEMVREIATEAERTADYTGRPVLDARVLEIISKVPRHLFVPPELAPFAYRNQPLPIGHGQTISQPFIVALMTDLARIGPNDKVLEIGVGGGYHTAILAELAKEVHSVEQIKPVAEAARVRLELLGYANAKVHLGDGYYGLSSNGPYDVIILRQAVNHLPVALARQLRPGGRLVAPIGPPDVGQQLMLVEKDETGAIHEIPVLPVIFTYLPGGDRI